MPFTDPARKREYQRSYQRAWHRERKAAFLKGKRCAGCGTGSGLCLTARDGRSLRDTLGGTNPWSLSRERFEALMPLVAVLCESCKSKLVWDRTRLLMDDMCDICGSPTREGRCTRCEAELDPMLLREA